MSSRFGLFVCFSLLLIAVIYATSDKKVDVGEQSGELKARKKREMKWHRYIYGLRGQRGQRDQRGQRGHIVNGTDGEDADGADDNTVHGSRRWMRRRNRHRMRDMGDMRGRGRCCNHGENDRMGTRGRDMHPRESRFMHQNGTFEMTPHPNANGSLYRGHHGMHHRGGRGHHRMRQRGRRRMHHGQPGERNSDDNGHERRGRHGIHQRQGRGHHGMRQRAGRRMHHSRTTEMNPHDNEGSLYYRGHHGMHRNRDDDQGEQRVPSYGRSRGTHHGRGYGMHGSNTSRFGGMHHGRGYGMHGSNTSRFGGMHHGRGYGMHGSSTSRFGGMHHGRGYGMHGSNTSRFGGMHHGHHNEMHHGHVEFHHHGLNGQEANGSEEDEGLTSERVIDHETGLPRLSLHAQRKTTILSLAQNRFTSSLHTQIGIPVTDIVYSPYSIFQGLTMVYMGSRSHTAFQMKRVLHLIGMGRHVHIPVMYQNMLLTNSGNSTLKIANNLILRPNNSVSEPFLDRLESSYKAGVSYFDWSHPDGPEANINEWVSNQTNSLIPTVLSPGAINQNTAMVLVNAIYFKAKWKTPFMEDRTSQQMFSKTATEQVSVQMMSTGNRFKMALVPGHAARVLELPYEGDRFSMLVILPDDINGLATLEEGLTADLLATNLDTVIPARVNVFLPRFRIETALSLKDKLQNMGMTKAFDPRFADFSGITFDDDIYISYVIHRAVVDVNEEGSEAAGATVVTMLGSGQSSPMDEFRCDHPFLFIIRDNVSKVNLFVGKFSGGS